MGDIDEEVVIDILENLELSLPPPETCIYRVRPSIRKINEAAYTPRLVSIGPFHYGNPEFHKMESQKLTYLKLFCQRLKGHMTEKQAVNHLWRIIKDCEAKIRHCYDEPCNPSCSKFVKMILLDSIFIIELALRQRKSQFYGDDVIIGAPWMRNIIVSDLSLIENQLPYFIIKRLYEETPFPKPLKFDELMFELLSVKLSKETLSEGVKHFVDLFRCEVLDRTPREMKAGRTLNLNYSKLKYAATKLHEAGVKFEPVEHKDELRLDIEFTKGVLKIPVLEVGANFELLCRNLMEFEQLHHPAETYICNYFFFLDNLINTSEDVELLIEDGIVCHWYGSNKLFAELINRMCQGLGDYRTCYSSIYKELNKHYENKCNRRKAALKLVYFSNLWRGTATVAAGVLLLMTLLQTIFSAKSL